MCYSAFWLAPFSIPFDHVCASDLLLIDHSGNVIAGGKPGDGQLCEFHSAITTFVSDRRIG
jgi:hypothetical protein